LVIAPLSTIGNWSREFEVWTDLNAIVYHGTSGSRNMIQEYEMYFKDEKVFAKLENCLLLLIYFLTITGKADS
jgi:SNF2 family DNA or RNA helicase